MALVKCPFCNKDISPRAQVCPKCGEDAPNELVKCIECGTLLRKNADVCTNCGEPDPFIQKLSKCVECGELLAPDLDTCTNCGEPNPFITKHPENTENGIEETETTQEEQQKETHSIKKNSEQSVSISKTPKELYDESHSYHYDTNNVYPALRGYREIIQKFPQSKEAGYSKTQIGNILNSHVKLSDKDYWRNFLQSLDQKTSAPKNTNSSYNNQIQNEPSNGFQISNESRIIKGTSSNLSDTDISRMPEGLYKIGGIGGCTIAITAIISFLVSRDSRSYGLVIMANAAGLGLMAMGFIAMYKHYGKKSARVAGVFTLIIALLTLIMAATEYEGRGDASGIAAFTFFSSLVSMIATIIALFLTSKQSKVSELHFIAAIIFGAELIASLVYIFALQNAMKYGQDRTSINNFGNFLNVVLVAKGATLAFLFFKTRTLNILKEKSS